jgi:DNA-binding transcriptional LysR family regulator
MGGPHLSPPLSDTDLRLLRIFRTIAESGGFTPAQVELNISRSAISQHMSDLEARLGLRLCQRGRAGFLLTDEGRAVYAAIQRLLSAAENFSAEINAVHDRLRGELNIGITDSLVTSPRMRVTNAIRNLKRRGPDVRVNIRMTPPNEIERGVLDGQLHVGVAPARRVLPGLLEMSLYDEESRLYCASDHPLAHNSNLTKEMVESADAVAPVNLSPSTSTSLRVTASAADREGTAFLILTGCYIGFLPTHYASHWVDRHMMTMIMPEYYSQRLEYRALTLRSRQINLVLDAFWQLLQQGEIESLDPAVLLNS